MSQNNFYKADESGSKFVKHDGIGGMKWGRRRYQNEDGTWTAEGLARRREQYRESQGDGWEVSGAGRDIPSKSKSYTPPKSAIYIKTSGKTSKSKETIDAEKRAKAAEKQAEKSNREAQRAVERANREAQKAVEKANKEAEKAAIERDKALKEAEEARAKTAKLIKEVEKDNKKQEQKNAKKDSQNAANNKKASNNDKKKDAEVAKLITEKREENEYKAELERRKAGEQALRSTVSTIDSTNNFLRTLDNRERRRIANSIDLSSLTTEEMNQIINRFNTEQRYIDAVANRSPSKYEKARQFLETAGGIVTIGVGLTGIATAIYQMRHGK